MKEEWEGMSLEYADQVQLQDVDRDELPEAIDNKVSLPDTYLDYGECASAWGQYYSTVMKLEGWGVKTLQEEVRLVHYHLDLADTHLARVRVSLETVNSEKRYRLPKTDTQVKVFTAFFTKLDPIQFASQVKVFNITPPSEERSKEMVIADLVAAAIGGE